MPNDWIDDKPKDAGWLDKKPTETPPTSPLKSLKDLDMDRQKASEAPKPEPLPMPSPEPIEAIPYDKVANDLENAAQDTLAAFSRLGRASVNLNKISIVVASEGPKGKELLGKSKQFQSRVDSICLDLKKISEEIANYKNSLPKDTAPQI